MLQSYHANNSYYLILIGMILSSQKIHFEHWRFTKSGALGKHDELFQTFYNIIIHSL